MNQLLPNELEKIQHEQDINEIFKLWEKIINNPEVIVCRLADIFESEASKYMLKDPDPFDERHPSPTSDLGKNLKLLFKKENFMNRLVNDYLRENFFTRQNVDKSSFNLNVAACRLILIIMPGLETSAVFQASNSSLINRLYEWIENAEEPLKSYAVALLGSAMDIQEIAIAYREQNIRTIPMLLQRLKTLQQEHLNVSEELKSKKLEEESNVMSSSSSSMTTNAGTLKRHTASLYPPTLVTKQMLILQYLTPMGEYQEFLPFIFEQNAIEIIFCFLDNETLINSNIIFEALKYVASLLCHKKFCLEFLNKNGLQKILKLPKLSTIATGTAIALYYIAYCEEAMERICSMPPGLVSELMAYVLGLLNCVHDSGRCHATMFLGFCFQFKTMLDEFDFQDGLRQLYNVISVLPVLEQMTDNYDLSSDEENAQRQVVRHVCVALKKYFESHIFYKYSLVTQNSPTRICLPMRSLKNSNEIINDQIMNLQSLQLKSNWQPVNVFLQLGGIKLLILVIAHSYEWNYSGRQETVISALDVINICCSVQKVHAVLCERIDFPEDASAAGINIILGAAEGEIVADPDVQKSALSLLVNCICAPVQKAVHKASGSTPRFSGIMKKKNIEKNNDEKLDLRTMLNDLPEDQILTEEVQISKETQKVWETVRSNNGIIVLLQLILIKTPITDADYLRGMACRALAGLARSETVRQIISKLPIFVNGQLQQLMRDPILQEKRSEHVKFQKYALELIERISGKALNMDTSLANIHKANVIAQTRVQFNGKQLLLLIHRHLLEIGLSGSANLLLKEGKLEQSPVKKINQNEQFYRSPMAQRLKINKRTADISNHQNDINLSNLENFNRRNFQSTSTTDEPIAKAILTPIKLIKKQASIAQTSQTQGQQNASFLEKQPTDIFMTLPSSHKTTTLSALPCVSLNTIVTEYLTNQHSLCKNPMSTCPLFDLFKPHKCPDPKPNRNVLLGLNVASRFFKKHQGYSISKLDRRFVHSNFNASRTLRTSEVDICFTACDFYTAEDNCLITGTHNGEIKVFHINDSNEDFSASCSDSYINNIKCSRNGELFLTSCTWHAPLSVLWCIRDKQIFSKLTLEEEEYVEFSNTIQDKVLGTKNEKATIYDITTGQVIRTLVPTIFNQYNKNRATFCPSDELILSDGVLWDYRSSNQIHKFDKLNNTLSGVFHPNGLEIISNSEVWDIRTFHLLRTIPSLDQSQIKFSPFNVMYTFNIHTETSDDEHGYDSSFKVLDNFDYSSIATIDVKKSIYDLSINNNGCQVAICENQGGFESVSESVVRVYAVGRKRDPEGEIEEEEEIGSEEEEEEIGSDENDENEIADRRRRQRRLLDINRENLNNVDIISLSTESLSSEFSDQFESSNENIANSDEEFANDNASNDGSNDSSWQTEDEIEDFH